MILGTYDESYGELLEDQWLLKLRKRMAKDPGTGIWQEDGMTGFFSKLTQKGALPKPFVDWGGTNYGETGKDLPVYVFQEYYRTGWKLLSWRFGQSQNWAVMRHPEGFTLEIYLDNFLDVVKQTSMDQGVILGEYKWENNRLIRKS